MSASVEYIVRYHHGGKLVSLGTRNYENGKIDKFGMDRDKICYWDLLEYIQVLGYDINKTVNFFYVDGDGDKTLKQISSDVGL